ncbi:MAG: TetR/AcrR family transcriptional regulator [Halioglobus sp.]|nr:TetR/AcrR family transcriptional regulator [Halioglobus sp.]
MARPPEFDRRDAVDAALHLFWEQGYNATSLSQLLEVMAINRSSFYAAFRDKRSLFIEVLELFARRTRDILEQVDASDDPLGAIRHFFEVTLFEVPARRARRGCLLVNTVLESAYLDDELSRLSAERLAEMERAFERCFRRAIDAGQIDARQDPAKLAGFIMTLNQGLRVASRKMQTRRELDDILTTGLSLLPIAV